ncbi:MAG: HNH endonuclease [Planctomycetota bacterium]|nr:HNH endonuclease [Planctomycetota bacterium]
MIACDRQGLHSQVLLLNRFYMAMQIISGRQAFILLCREAAEVIDVEEKQFYTYSFELWQELSLLRLEENLLANWIRSSRQKIEVPKVIRLTNYEKIPKTTLRFSRKNLYLRDNRQCQYCGKQLSFSQLSLDHVKPRSKGGDTSWENIVCSCTQCNTRKGCRTPQEASMQLLSKPARPHPFASVKMEPEHENLAAWQPFLQPRKNA